MPAATTHPARFSILTVELPQRDPVSVGILLEDTSTDRLYLRLRRDWPQCAPDDAEVLSALEADLASKAAESGASQVLVGLEDTLSNTVRISDRRDVIVEDFGRALARLYREHIRSNVQEFVTHLPRYSLAVAAGPFLENHTVEAQGWEEAPAGLRLTPEMFVARVMGRSMEPLIPDGALCVFRRGVTGSREGRLVLVEAIGDGSSDRYTVKRYRSQKTAVAGDESGESWSHARIRLEPLNPEFAAWDLNPEEDRYRILAEFVQVLD